jgi:hypothetical protein
LIFISFTFGYSLASSVILTKDLNLEHQLNPMAVALIGHDPLARQYAKERALKLFRQKKNIVKMNLMLPPVARSFIPRQCVCLFCFLLFFLFFFFELF